jgi:hypothetical protein
MYLVCDVNFKVQNKHIRMLVLAKTCNFLVCTLHISLRRLATSLYALYLLRLRTRTLQVHGHTICSVCSSAANSGSLQSWVWHVPVREMVATSLFSLEVEIC